MKSELDRAQEYLSNILLPTAAYIGFSQITLIAVVVALVLEHTPPEKRPEIIQETTELRPRSWSTFLRRIMKRPATALAVVTTISSLISLVYVAQTVNHLSKVKVAKLADEVAAENIPFYGNVRDFLYTNLKSNLTSSQKNLKLPGGFP